MKKLFVAILSVLLSAAIFSVYADNQEKSPFMTRTFSASSIKTVEASTSGGNLTLTGDADSNATVEMYVSKDNWSTEKIKKAIDDNYTIDIKVENGKLYVSAKQKNTFFNWNQDGLSISFKISVPKQVNSTLQTSGGSIHISNLSGSQNFKTSGGSLAVENTSGSIIGATSGGSINVTGAKDNIDLKTSGGSIMAADCNGQINLMTSGGSLSLSNLSGTINASTSGGSISASDIKGTLKTGTSGGSIRIDGISGNVEASTSGGNMDVKITSVSDYVKLSNNGSINMNLPTSGKGYVINVKASKLETTGTVEFRGTMNNNSMDGVIGRGGSNVEIKATQQVRLTFD